MVCFCLQPFMQFTQPLRIMIIYGQKPRSNSSQSQDFHGTVQHWQHTHQASNQVSDGGGLIKKSISTKSSQRVVAKENKKDVSLGRAHSNVCLLPHYKKQLPVDLLIRKSQEKSQSSIFHIFPRQNRFYVGRASFLAFSPLCLFATLHV